MAELDFRNRTPDFPELTGIAGNPDATAGGFDLGLRRDVATRLFDDQRSVGPERGQVPLEDVRLAGGTQDPNQAIVNIRESMRPQGVLENTNAFLDSINGRLNQEQRALGPKMSAWQKGLMFIADINAVSSGRMPPSVQLSAEFGAVLTAQDQARRSAFMDGVDTLPKFADSLMNLPRDQRVAVAESQCEAFDRNFGPNFCLMARSLVSAPSRLESFQEMANNPEAFEGTSFDSLLKLATFQVGAGVDPDVAIKPINDYIADGGLEKSAFSRAPTTVEQKLGGLMGELRSGGGSGAVLASKIDSGKRFTAEELIAASRSLPANSASRLTELEESALQKDPKLFLSVFPGMFTADDVIEERKASRQGLRSAPASFVLMSEDGEIVDARTAPQSSDEAIGLMRRGWHRINDDVMSLYGGGGADQEEIERLRDDFNKESQFFVDVQRGYASVRGSLRTIREAQAAGEINQQAYLGLLTSIARMYDPGSVVREGELRMAQSARSRLEDAVPENVIKRVLEGQALTDEQVDKIETVANNLLQEQKSDHVGRVENRYREIADLRRIDNVDTVFGFSRVRGDFPESVAGPESAAPAAAGAAGRVSAGSKKEVEDALRKAGFTVTGD